VIRPILVALTFVLAAQPAFSQPDDRTYDWSFRHRNDGVHLRILRDYHLAEGDTVNDPIVVIGGSANIDGRAEREIVVIGGTLRIGPSAVIRGDLVTFGGEAIVDPRADVPSEIAETIVTWPDVGFTWGRFAEGWWAVAAFAAMLVRLSVVFIASLFLTLVAPRWIRNIGARVGSSTGVSILVGFAGELLFLPALVVIAIGLVISIIGIPLLGTMPFLIGAAAVIWVAGFAGVAARLGARLRGSDFDYTTAPIGDLIVGFIAITACSVIAHVLALGPGWLSPTAVALGAVGLVIEYIAWTIGLGAAIASIFGRQRSMPPPPVPISVPSPAPTTI
jgi:hypothetical protein